MRRATVLHPQSVGRLLTAQEVADELFRGHYSKRWVLDHVVAGRVKIGHKPLWEENTVKAWIARNTEVGE